MNIRLLGILLLTTPAVSVSWSQLHTGKYEGNHYTKKWNGYFHEYQLKTHLANGTWQFYDYDEDFRILRQEVTVVNHKIHGIEKLYYHSGLLKNIHHYSNGEADSTWTRYHPDGSIISIENYSNGKKHGLQTYYQTSTDNFETFEYVDGKKEGPNKQYWGDSITHSVTIYKNNEQNGPYTAWHSNGQMSVSGNYYPFKKYDYRFSMHNRTGVWNYWNELGQLIKTEVWEHAELISIVEHISTNPFPMKPDTIYLADQNCFGKYCLGNNIHLCATRSGGFVTRGEQRLYTSYVGDSLDRISLTPIEGDSLTIHRLSTSSPRFRTAYGNGVGSTIKAVIESGEKVELISSNGYPEIRFTESGIIAGLDDNTQMLFMYGPKINKIEQLWAKGFITFLELER